MATKYTLNLKTKDNNDNTKNFSVGYVNPSATDPAYRTLAEKLVGLTNLTLTELKLTRVADITDGNYFLGKFQIISSSDILSTTKSVADAKVLALYNLVPDYQDTDLAATAQYLDDNGVVYEKAVTMQNLRGNIFFNAFDMTNSVSPNTATTWNITATNPNDTNLYAPTLSAVAKPITLTTYSITVADSGDGQTFMNAYLKDIYDNADATTKTYFPNVGSGDYSLVIPLKGV